MRIGSGRNLRKIGRNTKRNMRAAIYTLGCKVNQYETQALEAELVRRGHTLVPFDAEADAYLINTCTVTAVSDKKSRQAIRRAKKHPGAVVAVLGCYTQTNPQAAAVLGADLVSGTQGRTELLDRLEALVQARSRPAQAQIQVEDILHCRSFERLPAGGLEGRTRAMLKIEDGCSNFCSYCIIPYARGPVRSLPKEEAAAEAVRLERAGFRELVLTGIEISSWGVDFRDGSTLMDLIEAVCAAAPSLRVRLGSLEPRTITKSFCQRGQALPNLCPHFHLSLQSGCDATLARMNRKYHTARYYESIQLLRGFFDRPGITSDVIVGFPGETEEEFQQTLDFLRVCAFSDLHLFPYSRRSGTPADGFPGQISNAEKASRVHRAAEVAAQMEHAWLERWIGQLLPVLFEEEREGLWRGHAPNYIQVFAPGTALHNQIRVVQLTGFHPGGLEGEIVSCPTSST